MPSSGEHTVGEAVRVVTRRLAEVGADNPHLEAEILVREATGLIREQLLAHPECKMAPEAGRRLEAMAARRETREPLAYILGRAEFYSLTFRVTPAAIVPRPETEILVEEAVKRAREIGAQLLVDVGTGSGAIAVALAKELPGARVVAADVSRDALHLARENCTRHGVLERVLLVGSDLFSALQLEADGIIANLPYVESDALSQLQPEVWNSEPRLGLDGGDDGLEVIRRASAQLATHLSRGGFATLEVGAGQAGEVANLAAAGGLTRIEVVRDYAGIERVVIGWRAG